MYAEHNGHLALYLVSFDLGQNEQRFLFPFPELAAIGGGTCCGRGPIIDAIPAWTGNYSCSWRIFPRFDSRFHKFRTQIFEEVKSCQSCVWKFLLVKHISIQSTNIDNMGEKNKRPSF